MTLENTPAAAYLRTEEKQNARVMEADGSVSLRDSGISDATTTQPSSSSVLSCILCMECIGDWNALKRHLLKVKISFWPVHHNLQCVVASSLSIC